MPRSLLLVMGASFACSRASLDRRAPAPPDEAEDTGVDDQGLDPDSLDPAAEVPADLSLIPAAPCHMSAPDGVAGRFEPWDAGPQWEGQPPGSDTDDAGWGLAVEDFDGDGRLDIFLPHWGRSQLFLQQEDGRFADASDRLPPVEQVGQSVVAGDLDSDGDVDIVLGTLGLNPVWLNDGEGRFTELAEPFGATAGAYDTRHLSLGDLDRDGHLDLFEATFVWEHGPEDWGVEPNGLFLGRGDGSFESIGEEQLGDLGMMPCLASGFVDANADGLLDLYMVPDKPDDGFVPVLLLGDGEGGLEPATNQGGLDFPIEAMGLAEGDFNGDGLFDYAITGWDEHALLLSAGEGMWAESALALGLSTNRDRVVGWGVEFADPDLDGDLDILVAHGPDYDFDGNRAAEGLLNNPTDQKFGYYQNDGGVLIEKSGDMNLFAWGNYRGFVLADLDGDGSLDLVARNLYDRALLMRGGCDSDASWLSVRAEQPADPNGRAIGARVELHTEKGVQLRYIRAATTNIASSGPPVAHFGLNGLDQVQSIVIRWPDGAWSEVGPVEARQHVRVIRR